MMKIIAAPLPDLRNEQHLSLMADVKRLVSEEPAVKQILVEEEPQFSDALAAEVVAEKVASGSEITKSMDVFFALRAKHFTGLEHAVEMGLCHFDPTIENVAASVKTLMDKYGNINRKTNAEKTVAFRNLTDELLSAENLPKVTQIGVKDWAEKVKEENDEYSALSDSRTKEEKGRPSGNVHDARDVTDRMYHTITNRVNAAATLNGEANYASFINQLNGAIEALKATMSQQLTARKKQVLPPPPNPV
jgi:hypothetical protein